MTIVLKSITSEQEEQNLEYRIAGVKRSSDVLTIEEQIGGGSEASSGTIVSELFVQGDSLHKRGASGVESVMIMLPKNGKSEWKSVTLVMPSALENSSVTERVGASCQVLHVETLEVVGEDRPTIATRCVATLTGGDTLRQHHTYAEKIGLIEETLEIIRADGTSEGIAGWKIARIESLLR